MHFAKSFNRINEFSLCLCEGEVMKDFWNERYSEDGLAYGTKPNVYLTEVVDQISPGGNVLVIGDGEGRNGVWLAEQGFNVTSVDYSHVAIEKIKSLAESRNVNITAICADLVESDWPPGDFDAVVAIYLHFPSSVRAKMHEEMLTALKPGGKVIIEAFTKDQLKYSSGGPPVEDMLFSADILKADFTAANIIELCEKIVHLNEGKYHVGDGAIVRLIAEKPLAPDVS